MRGGGKLLVAIFISACSASGCGLLYEDLERPMYIWEQDNSLCGLTRVVDRHRDVWLSQACEDSGSVRYFNVGALTSAAYEQLRNLYAAFPPQQSSDAFCSQCACRHRFVLATDGEPGVDRMVWSHAPIKHLDELKEPYLSVALILSDCR